MRNFPTKTKEIEYINEEPYCSFKIILDIITNYSSYNDKVKSLKLKNISQIKKILIDEYKKYENRLLIISNILSSEGKINISRKLLLGEVNIETLIISQNYYITNLDIFLLSKKLELPIILLSSTKLTENNKPFLKINNSLTNNYYFIKNPSPTINEAKYYRLYQYNENYIFNLNQLNEDFKNDINNSQIFDLENYIENYPIKFKF